LKRKPLDIGELFQHAFERWKLRIWTLLGLLLIFCLAMLVSALVLAMIVVGAYSAGFIELGVILAGLIFLVLFLWAGGWYGATYYQLIRDDSLELKAAIIQSREHAWSFQGVQFFPAIAIFSGLLFCLIPGLALIPLFAFAPFAYFDGASVTLATHRSFQLVKPHYWVVLLLVYLGFLVPSAGSVLPVVGIVISLALGPFSSLLLHEIYKDLCAVAPRTLPEEDPQVKVIFYVSTIVMILVAGGILGLSFYYGDDLIAFFEKLLPKR
jgi:hypothetical protein